MLNENRKQSYMEYPSIEDHISVFQYQGAKEFANGWFWPEEGEWYKKMCQKIQNGKIIEIGSWEGLSLSYIKSTIQTNNNKIWSVEINCNKRLAENTEKWGIELICKSSVDASLTFPNGFFDLIYIDASHQYEDVKADILAWMPKLRIGGIIAGHDYDHFWPGVAKAVNELIPSRSLEGRNWSFIKLNSIGSDGPRRSVPLDVMAKDDPFPLF